MNPHSQDIDVEPLGPFKIVDGDPNMINTLEIDLTHGEFSFFQSPQNKTSALLWSSFSPKRSRDWSIGVMERWISNPTLHFVGP
jgi:hypothetical protein